MPNRSVEDVRSIPVHLDQSRSLRAGKYIPTIHVIGYFNLFTLLLSKATWLSQTEGQILIDIINDIGLEQRIDFPTSEAKSWFDTLNSHSTYHLGRNPFRFKFGLGSILPVKLTSETCVRATTLN